MSSTRAVTNGTITGYPEITLTTRRTLAYDGRGNHVIQTTAGVKAAIEALGSGARPLYAEQMMSFVCEVAVMVVRSSDGQLEAYPAVETLHRNNICHLVFAPLRTNGGASSSAACELAKRAVACLGPGAVGVFGVEMFLLPDGE